MDSLKGGVLVYLLNFLEVVSVSNNDLGWLANQIVAYWRGVGEQARSGCFPLIAGDLYNLGLK